MKPASAGLEEVLVVQQGGQLVGQLVVPQAVQEELPGVLGELLEVLAA